jgi:hypothetical protein
MSEEKLIDNICEYLGKNYLLKNNQSMRWTPISKIKNELLQYCILTKMDKKKYFSDLCEKLNTLIPCKNQKDIDEMTNLLQDMVDFPSQVKPQIYWDREVWMDSGFNDEICMNMLIKTDKLYFEPSDDINEHPGVWVKYKWMKEQ